jgi:hypothetical protein
VNQVHARRTKSDGENEREHFGKNTKASEFPTKSTKHLQGQGKILRCPNLIKSVTRSEVITNSKTSQDRPKPGDTKKTQSLPQTRIQG